LLTLQNPADTHSIRVFPHYLAPIAFLETLYPARFHRLTS
jgi:hypothetical protein